MRNRYGKALSRSGANRPGMKRPAVRKDVALQYQNAQRQSIPRTSQIMPPSLAPRPMVNPGALGMAHQSGWEDLSNQYGPAAQQQQPENYTGPNPFEDEGYSFPEEALEDIAEQAVYELGLADVDPQGSEEWAQPEDEFGFDDYDDDDDDDDDMYMRSMPVMYGGNYGNDSALDRPAPPGANPAPSHREGHFVSSMKVGAGLAVGFAAVALGISAISTIASGR